MGLVDVVLADRQSEAQPLSDGAAVFAHGLKLVTDALKHDHEDHAHDDRNERYRDEGGDERSGYGALSTGNAWVCSHRELLFLSLPCTKRARSRCSPPPPDGSSAAACDLVGYSSVSDRVTWGRWRHQGGVADWYRGVPGRRFGGYGSLLDGLDVRARMRAR
ncbi:MAG: hypothetical protein SangKO_067790 [Sandaracinaceae bacterium]